MRCRSPLIRSREDRPAGGLEAEGQAADGRPAARGVSVAPQGPEPDRVDKAPPPPLSERPGIDPPSATAEWIEGYWEWDASKKDFVWVTGTWRVPPPGRFWVNGYWKRDDHGWYRVSGFWSERKTDRLDYRKNGPPQERPDDEPGEPPSADCFFIPGQYYPDGDGVTWKKGFWAKVQPGWSWVPAQWVRQPDGWVFQDGYWDRTLDDRGTLFAPAEVDKTARGADDLTYQPYTTVPPEVYGQLNGAFGRPNSNYDGYPGVYYDDTGRYYGYASYGYLNGNYGYLDYPYYGGLGSPYYATPVQYGMGGYGYGVPRRVRLWRDVRRPAGRGTRLRDGLRRLRLWVPVLRRLRRRLSVASAVSATAARIMPSRTPISASGYGGYGGFGYGARLRWFRLRRLRSGTGFWLRLPRLRVRLRVRLSVLRLRASDSAALGSVVGPWRLGLGAWRLGAIASRSPTGTYRSIEV